MEAGFSGMVAIDSKAGTADKPFVLPIISSDAGAHFEAGISSSGEDVTDDVGVLGTGVRNTQRAEDEVTVAVLQGALELVSQP